MREKIGWGIMATGTIANKFCEGLKNLRDTEIVAVASRSLDRALDFGRKHGIKRAYGCYEELVMDSEVDIVYIQLLILSIMKEPCSVLRPERLYCVKSRLH